MSRSATGPGYSMPAKLKNNAGQYCDKHLPEQLHASRFLISQLCAKTYALKSGLVGA
jgi:hypothetical protein